MLHIYPVPAEETLSPLFSVWADGQSVPVSACDVSAMPFNRRWPGHQRSKDQSEPAAFVRLAMDGAVTFTVKPNRAFTQVELRPRSKGVVPTVCGDEITFTLTEPGFFSLELDGYHNNLHIFADPMPCYAIDRADENLLYFGPGVHEAGILHLVSNQTVYIDEGAIVYGCIHADDAENIRVLGRGILDNSHNVETILFEVKKLGDGEFDMKNSVREHTVHLVNCKGVEINGITIRNSLVYNVGLWACEDITIDDIKIIGCWRYNSDGVDFHNCRRGVLRNSFLRTFDDTICYKGHGDTKGRMLPDGSRDPERRPMPEVCEDLVSENCVVWCDWDHTLEIGAECRARHMRNLVFRNIDVIHSLDIAMSIFNVDYGTVHNVVYEDIRVEYDAVHQRPQIQRNDEHVFPVDPQSPFQPYLIACSIIRHPEYSEELGTRGLQDFRGHIEDISFRDIRVYAPKMPPIRFSGYDAEHLVERITIQNLSWNDQPISEMEQLNLSTNEFTRDILLR